MAHADPLLRCLVHLAEARGLKADAQAMVHGLPLREGRLPPEHLDEAARRAGLELAEWRRPATALEDAFCPLLALCEGEGGTRAFVVLSIAPSREGRGPEAEILLPDGSRQRQALKALCSGSLRLWLASPAPRADDRTAGLPLREAPHWLWSAFAPNIGIYLHVLLATFVINLLALSIPLVTMNVYDRVVANAAFSTLWSLALGAALAALFDLLLKTARAAMVDRAAARSDVILANRIFARLLGARLAGRNASTGVRANALREFEALREFFNSATVATFGDLPFVFLFIAVMAMVAGPLALVPLAAIPLVLAAAWLTHRGLLRSAGEIFARQAHKNAVAVETLTGLESIKAHAAESWAAAKWEEATAAHLRHSLKSRHLSALGGHVIGFITQASTIALLVWGVYLVTDQAITPGAMFAAMILNGRVMAPLAAMAGLLSRLHQAKLAHAALKQIVELPQERRPGASYLRRRRWRGEVAFEDVDFAYEEDAAPALRGVSFHVRPGERVAIVGGIGSGKSTLLRLIMGLHVPRAGRVLIDGLPVTQIDPAALRRGIGALPGEDMLFHGTLRENLTLGRPGHDDEAILRALRTSGAAGWIARLPAGLDTVIGERGEGLSSGQRQSLALARALLGAPPLLLLDEPTSHMDGRMEAAFIEAMKAREGQTLLLVTHRPALLALARRMIVLEHGEVLLDGPKEQVLAELKAITERRKGAVA